MGPYTGWKNQKPTRLLHSSFSTPPYQARNEAASDASICQGASGSAKVLHGAQLMRIAKPLTIATELRCSQLASLASEPQHAGLEMPAACRTKIRALGFCYCSLPLWPLEALMMWSTGKGQGSFA